MERDERAIQPQQPGSEIGADRSPRIRPDGWPDLQPRLIYMPDSYEWTTDGPVRYLPVVRGETVLGYLWASVDDKAAKYVERQDASAAGWNAGVPWIQRLREAKAGGLTPLEALRHWIGAPEDPRAGAVPAGAVEQELPSLRALHELAAGN